MKNAARAKKRVLINNYYKFVTPRGIIAYVNDLESYLSAKGIECRVISCPRFMKHWPKHGIWFHLFEQAIFPMIALRYDVVIYPYNSASLLSIFHRGSLLIVHDFIAYRRRLPGYSALSAKLVRWTQYLYRKSRRDVAFITEDVAREARFTNMFPKSRTMVIPNVFFEFSQIAKQIPAAKVERKNYILLCSGKVPTKDLNGALCLYRDSVVAKNYKLKILGLAGDSKVVDEVFRDNSMLRDRIEVLPIVSIENLVSLYKNSEVTWVHSLSEGFGRNLSEALICGAKVVASNIRPLRLQVSDIDSVEFYKNDENAGFDDAFRNVMTKKNAIRFEGRSLNAVDAALRLLELQ